MAAATLTGQLERVTHIAAARTGKRPSAPTVWRWCKKGLRGGRIRLQAVYHSGAWMTTVEAFEEFLDAQTAYMLSDDPELSEATDDDLRAEGLL